MSLRTRLAVFIAAAVGVAVAAVALVAYGFAAGEAHDEIDDFLRHRSPAMGPAGSLEIDAYRNRPGRGPNTGSGIIGTFDAVIREDAVAQFVEANGAIITLGFTGVVLPVDEHDLGIAAEGGPDYFRDVHLDGVHYRVLTRPLFDGFAIQVGRDVTPTDQILAGLRLRLTLLGVGGVVLAAGIAWLLARRTLRPVAALTDAAEDVAATRSLESRIEVHREDELGRLAAAFNRMLAALEEARSSQQRLVADASHELRTPLTSLRTNIELLARGAVAGSDRDELLQDLTSEVEELSHLVAELVELATVGRDEEPLQDIDLAVIASQAVERTRRHSEVAVTNDLQPTPLSGRPGALLRAVTNLLDNAAKWGNHGGSIEVELRDRVLTVRDHGPGIPDDDLAHVFERFYRSPAARSQPGSGLGLSIVAAVVEDHGGSVFARNAPDGGAIVGFELPSGE